MERSEAQDAAAAAAAPAVTAIACLACAQCALGATGTATLDAAPLQRVHACPPPCPSLSQLYGAVTSAPLRCEQRHPMLTLA